MKQKHIPQSVIARQNAARKASDALDAVPVLKRHFARILADEKIGEPELKEFTTAAVAISTSTSSRQVAFASLGAGLVTMLWEHYERQIDVAFLVGPDASGRSALSPEFAPDPKQEE